MTNSVFQVEQRISQLDHELASLQAQRTSLSAELLAINAQVASAHSFLGYYHFALWFRAPATTFEYWPIGVMFSATATFGAVSFLLTNAATESWLALLTATLCGAWVAIAIFGSLLFFPDTSTIQRKIIESEALRSGLHQKREVCRKRLSKIKEEFFGLEQITIGYSTVISISSELFRREAYFFWMDSHGSLLS